MVNEIKTKEPATAVYRLFGFDFVSEYPFSRLLFKEGESLDGLSSPVHIVFDTQPPFQVDLEFGELIYTNPFSFENSESNVCFYKFQTYHLLRFTNLVDFFLRSNRIDCRIYNNYHQPLVEDLFLGAVMSVWLELQDMPVLHASAMVINGQLAAFPADSGNGKTTLATALLQAGHALFTDDIFPLENRLDGFWSHPGAPGLNLWPDQSIHFLGDSDFPYLPRNMLKPNKTRIPVGRDSFYNESKVLRSIYLPNRLEPGNRNANIKIEPVKPAEAVIELIHHSFARYVMDRLGWQARRLEFFARLVKQVPVRRLLYPSGFEYLPRVTDAILQDLERLKSQ